jgi:hypothetical protein
MKGAMFASESSSEAASTIRAGVLPLESRPQLRKASVAPVADGGPGFAGSPKLRPASTNSGRSGGFDPENFPVVPTAPAPIARLPGRIAGFVPDVKILLWMPGFRVRGAQDDREKYSGCHGINPRRVPTGPSMVKHGPSSSTSRAHTSVNHQQ